jgi:hypothetical protein
MSEVELLYVCGAAYVAGHRFPEDEAAYTATRLTAEGWRVSGGSFVKAEVGRKSVL